MNNVASRNEAAKLTVPKQKLFHENAYNFYKKILDIYKTTFVGN